MTDIWHYHPDTGLLTGQSVADEDPREPGRAVIPAHATDITPPETGSGMVPKFMNGEWFLVPVHTVNPAALDSKFDMGPTMKDIWA